MYVDNISKVKLLETLIHRECFHIRARIESFGKRRYVIFPAGQTAQKACLTLQEEYGVDIAFFIDNDQEKEGKYVCNKEIKYMPWSSVSNFSDEYIVIIATAWEFAHGIEEQLQQNGINSFIHWWQYQIAFLWTSDKFCNINNLLEDELSKISYYGALYNMLTSSEQFVQTVPEHYFAAKQFAYFDRDVIIDAGAYNGDDTIEFFKRSYGTGKAYIFEPMPNMIPTIYRNKQTLIKRYGLQEDCIKVENCGLGEYDGEIYVDLPTKGLGVTSSVGQSSQKVSIYSLDSYFKNKSAFTFLKCDIEGMEASLIRGGIKSIKRFEPKMAISIYHSVDDFISIIELIRTINPCYRFAVRNHNKTYQDTVLYAWIDQRQY